MCRRRCSARPPGNAELSFGQCHKVLTANSANLVLRFKGGVWEGSALAQIQGPKAVAWRDVLWLLMTVAGVLLLVCAALSV